jgi:hypothetical protein
VRAEDGGCAQEKQHIYAVSADAAGSVAALTSWWCHQGYDEVEHFTLHVFTGVAVPLAVPLPAYWKATAIDIQHRAGTVACAFGEVEHDANGLRQDTYIDVLVFDGSTGVVRAKIRLGMGLRWDPAEQWSGPPGVSLRLGDGTLTVADTRGRVLVVETEGGGLLLDARAGRWCRP